MWCDGGTAKREELLVLHAFCANFVADLSERYMLPS